MAPASAQPTGANVIAGQVTISTPAANATIINQASQKAIINWQDFSVAAGGSVRFNQPGASSITLNRVTGTGASVIEGAVRANGQVWLLNPNGVLFGPGANIHVGGLLATTADIANGDFLDGRYDFSGAPVGSSVSNSGAIKTSKGGSVVLSAPHVANRGLIAAQAGHVVLGGAEAFTVDFQGDNLIQYAVKAPAKDASAVNSGTIKAGTVLMTARAAANVADGVVNNSGMIEATAAHMENGDIVLDAGDGTASNSGTLDASGKVAGQSGGTVALLGKTVTVSDGAKIDVSGDAGGGQALIGGALHGAGPQPNAVTVTVGKATVNANAIRKGQGGTVAIYSTGTTHVAAAISAKGGAQGGNGGTVETSGHVLSVTAEASVSTAAPAGLAGTWLLDPDNLTISICTGCGSATQSWTTAGNAQVDPSVINTALGSGNVTLQANNDITVTNSNISSTAGNTLELDAGRSIVFSASTISNISGAGLGTGKITLFANNQGAALPADRQAGAGGITTDSTSTLAADKVDLIVGTLGTAGTVGSSSAPLIVTNGGTYIQAPDTNAYISTNTASAATDVVLGNADHPGTAVDLSNAGPVADLSITASGVTQSFTASGVTQSNPIIVGNLSVDGTAGSTHPNPFGDPVTLDNASNVITGTVTASAYGSSAPQGTSQISIANSGGLIAGAITVDADANGNQGSVLLNALGGTLYLTDNVTSPNITLDASLSIQQNGGILDTSNPNLGVGSIALNATGGSISLPQANILESGIAPTGIGSETAVTGQGELAFGAKTSATLNFLGSVALYGASSGGDMSITATGITNTLDTGGNTVSTPNLIYLYNPLTAGGFLTLHAAGDIAQQIDPARDVHILATGGMSATSDQRSLNLNDGGNGGSDSGNQIGGYVLLNALGFANFTNTVTTVLGGPDYPAGAPNGYTPPDSTIGDVLDVEVTDANQTNGAHSNLILAGRIHVQSSTPGTSTLHATGDLDNNSGSGTIYADDLSLISDFGSVGGDDGTHWTFGDGSNSGGVMNLQASAVNGSITINPGDLNIGITGLTGGFTAQSVEVLGNGVITQNNDPSGTITVGDLDLHARGAITLNNPSNQITGVIDLRALDYNTGTYDPISLTNSVNTVIQRASGDGEDANDVPLQAGDVTLVVHDPSGTTAPTLTLTNNTDYGSNAVASIESTGHVTLQADGAITDGYDANDSNSFAGAGHIIGSELSATSAIGSISLTNPASNFATLTAQTIDQDIAIATGQTGSLTVGDSQNGINAGAGTVSLSAPNASILSGNSVTAQQLVVTGASVTLGDVEVGALSARSSGGAINITSVQDLIISDPNGNPGINSAGGSVTLNGSSVTQASGPEGVILSGDLNVSATSGNGINLGNTANSMNGYISLISSGGDALLFDSTSTLLANASVAGTLTAQSGGDLYIVQGGSLTSQAAGGDGVVLAAAGNFINDAGANAITTSGARFLIYSVDPYLDTFGGLNSNNTAVWDTSYPTAISQAGNRYVFAAHVQLVVTVGDLTKTYGDDISATVPGDYTISPVDPGVAGAYLGDNPASVYSGMPAIASTGAGAGADAGQYAITAAQGSFQTFDGYTAIFQNGLLTVQQRALTLALQGNVTKTYDGNTAATLAAGNYSALQGAVNNDDVSLAGPPISGSYDTADAGAAKTVTVTGITLTGAKAQDYTIATSVSGSIGVIQQRTLSVALQGNVTKTYDGSNAAALAAGNYGALQNVVGNDDVSLAGTPSAGTYDSADAGNGKLVTVAGIGLTGAKAGDYTIAASVSGGIGVIQQRMLTVALQGNVTKTYDGNAAATLAAGNYGALQNVVGNDAVALVGPPIFGGYDSADAGSGKTVTVMGINLTGAKAGDYTIAASVSGSIGVIQQRTLTVALQGAVSKVYDGNTAATLASANYGALQGVVKGDTVSLFGPPTSGSYDTSAAGSGKTVTVTGIVLTGAQANDYAIASSVAGAIGTITAPATGNGTTPARDNPVLVTYVTANQNAANQPTRPGTVYLQNNPAPPENTGSGAPPVTPSPAVLVPATVNPIAELVQNEVDDSSPADQAADFLVASLEGGGAVPSNRSQQGATFLIPGLLRVSPGRPRAGSGTASGLSAWGNSALWQ